MRAEGGAARRRAGRPSGGAEARIGAAAARSGAAAEKGAAVPLWGFPQAFEVWSGLEWSGVVWSFIRRGYWVMIFLGRASCTGSRLIPTH